MKNNIYNIIIVVFGEITKNTAENIAYALVQSIQEKKDIIFLIDSGGGDGQHVRACAQLMKAVKNLGHKVITICLGSAYSAAAMLLMAGSKGYRYAVDEARIMIHHGDYTFPVPSLNSNTMEHVKKEQEFCCDFIKSHTNCSREQIEIWLSGRDTYFDVKQARSLGIIDHIGIGLPTIAQTSNGNEVL